MKKQTAIFEISLLIIAIFSFSYFVSHTNNFYYGENKESEFIKKTRNLLLGWLSKGLVSAQSEGLWTCKTNNDGALCQEYSSSECNSQCTENCFPGKRSDFNECTLGTCFDSTKGTCQAQTPKFACEESGGIWSLQTLGQCNKGCCSLSGQNQFLTETACNYLSQTSGKPLDGILNKFDPSVNNELACIWSSYTQQEGACVVQGDLGQKNECKFLKKTDCISVGGQFHENFLCSNPELNTVCEKQASTTCVDGKDEVYWLDSCGNRENIFDTNLIRSWNNGMVLSKQDSCQGSQQGCGNCNYLLGSVCGKPGSNDAKPLVGKFVCRDLNCADGRKHGESWCAFDGRIGVEGEKGTNEERSIEVPGSGHYRKICFEGEIRTEACAGWRGELCTENRESDFSSAACRINMAQVCLEANTDKNKLSECEDNTDCFLKKVEISEHFKLEVCAPRHPMGFDLKERSEAAQKICSIGSQKCIVHEVKEIFGWKCKYNCKCRNPEFTEAMNNLCISLGDCGGHITLLGEFMERGYGVHNAPWLTQSYIDGLKGSQNAESGQKVKPLKDSEIAKLFGLTTAEWNNGKPPKKFMIMGIVTGAAGIGAVFAAKAGLLSGTLFAASVETGTAVKETVYLPALSEAGGALAGALIGAASVALILHFTGITSGIPPALTYSLIIAGGVAGGFIGFGLLGGAASSSTAGILGGACAVIAGCIIVGIIAAIILTLYLLGVGKSRQIEVEFICKPWQPPKGGENCAQCGKGGLPCTKYKCNSLGQTCELVNEGTGEETCVNTSPNDVSAPEISPDSEVIRQGLTYTSITSLGFKISETSSQEGCITEYSPILFGIKLNEPGVCKIDSKRTSSFELMSNFMGGKTLYKHEHSQVLVAPSLSELGVTGFDPDRRGDHNLYIRCEDFSGNSNVQEFVVNMCVSPADDLTPPIITSFIPPNPGYTGLNITEKEFQLITNEPSECRFSKEDKSYFEMENSMVCNNALTSLQCSQTANGFVCGWICDGVFNLQDNLEDENFYFRCLDQPWLGISEDDAQNEIEFAKRNSNFQSIEYTIKKTKEPLVISSVKPNDQTIYSGFAVAKVELELTTSGGINGDAMCRYSFDGQSFLSFLDTGGKKHKQVFTSLLPGDYHIRLECKDFADNEAKADSIFTVEGDNNPPQIIFAYRIGQILNIITDEDSTCSYTNTDCGFNFQEGKLMNGNSKLHTTEFNPSLTYFVKCQDIFNNVGECLPIKSG